MMKKCIYTICAVCVAVFLAQGAYANTIDLWTQFPDNQGNNGFYVYSYSGTSYTLLPDSGVRSFGFGLPYIHGNAASPWLTAHPTNTLDAVLGWIVPETNTYDISGTVNDWGDGGAIYAYVKQNTTLIGGTILYSGSSNYSFDDVSLTAGDMLYFGINNYDGQGNDTTQFSGKIEYDANQAVPEPATMSLLGMGLAGLAGFRRKKKT